MENKKMIHILHLSDLHFLNDEKKNKNVKAPVQGNVGVNDTDNKKRFVGFIESLPCKPDYVVVSGDITTKANSDGFEIFHRLIVGLIEDDKLPDISKFIVVPGNHDVQKSAFIEDSQRWVNFKKLIGKKYLVPWIAGIDTALEDMKKLVDNHLDDSGKGSGPIGGVIQDRRTREDNNIPFLLDREKKVLFYAFNSSLASHTMLDDKEGLKLISDARERYSGDEKLMKLADKLEQAMEVDPAEIEKRELDLFEHCMDKIQVLLSNDYKNFLKIAVLHHHTAPISCVPEIKEFESLINAGYFKRKLADYEFNVVLHGHKHWNEVYLDTAISGGGALLTVSGGTMFGDTIPGKKAGFYLLDFSVSEKTMKPHYYEIQDDYSGVTDTKEVPSFRYDSANQHIYLAADIQQFNVMELFSRMKRALLRNIYCKENGDGSKQYGWSRNIISRESIGIASTAFGLIIAHMLRVDDIEYEKQKADIIETFWKFRSEGGGFRAVSQILDRAIEPTVWALRAFYYARDMKKFSETLQDLYHVIKENQLNEESSITTLTLVMDVLCECDPNSELLEKINGYILNKACKDNDDCPLYWPKSATKKEEGSAVHTMLAVISLLNYAKVCGRLEETRKYLNRCGEWILKAEWNNVEESITRQITSARRDKLRYDHYTLPWGIVALLRLGYSKKEKRITEEMKKLLKNEQDGLWVWETGTRHDYPIWAIYNAISAVNEFILSDIEL